MVKEKIEACNKTIKEQNIESVKLSDNDKFRIEFLKAMCEDKMSECTSYSTMCREMKETIAWLESLKKRII